MKKILVIRGSAIGDVIGCLPVASALKNSCGEECEIHWLVRRKFKKLLEGNRLIDKILCYEDYKDIQFRIVKRIYRRKKDLNGLEKWLPFSCVNKLKNGHYDAVINLHRKLDGRMFSVMSGAPKIITAPVLDSKDDLLYNQGKHRMVDFLETVKMYKDDFDIDGFLAQDIDYGWQFTEDELTATDKILRENDCNDGDYVAFVLGTTWESKNYPVENWIELTRLLVKNNKKVVFIGDSKDKNVLNQIRQNVKSELLIDLIGKTSLREMIMVLAKAAVVVGGDTGPMHIAASLNVKTITLMGPTYALKFAPYGKKSVVLIADYPCKVCQLVKCPKGIYCMKYIAPQRVLDTIISLLD